MTTRHRWHLSDPANESSSASRFWASPLKSCNGRLDGGLDVAFARSEPALRCRVVTGREETHSVTLESVGAVQISKTTPPRWPLQNTAHILQGWGRRPPNWVMRAPWRLTERRIASGHAPRAQNCPRSRLGRSECLRRPLGAANAAWSVGAAGAKNRNL